MVRFPEFWLEETPDKSGLSIGDLDVRRDVAIASITDET